MTRTNGKKIPHLHQDRHGTFYFRITSGGVTIKRSLKTKLPDLARLRVAALNWEWKTMAKPQEPTIDEIVKALSQGKGRKFDAEFPDGTKFTGINTDDDLRRAKELMLARIEAIGPIAPGEGPLLPQYRPKEPPKRPQKPFSKAVLPYLREKAKDGLNSEKTLEDKKATYQLFGAQFNDPDMSTIDKPMAVTFKQALLDTSAGAGRVNTKIGHLSDFFAWAVGNGLSNDNPFDGIRISKKSKLMETVVSYEPFSEDDLKLIFNPATWDEYSQGKPQYHWLPLLLLYSGARPNEIASLRLDQIRQDQGIDFIALKAAKNSNSIRRIPLHRVIRESAFMNYVHQRRASDPDGQLFPDLKPSKNGHAKNVSRRFNEMYLPTLRIHEPTKRIYSFRATFITRMSELNVNTAMLMALVGHFEQDAVDLSSPHFKNYQGAKRIGALQETIDLLDFKLPMAF